MELSLFLAKLFGIYLLIVALLWALRRDVISKVVEDFFASPAMMFMSGLMALVVGIAMAIGHSVWEWNWRGVITLFGYLSIAKGIARIGFPDASKNASGALLKNDRVWILIGLSLALGGYLTWVGFTHG